MRLSLDDKYQVLLIVLSIVVTGLFGVFLLRELFPEYKEYQKHYLALEEVRSDMTGIPVAPFKGGIQQIVMAKADKGPETIDRCVSCHVAMKLPHFSPTKVARDVNGNIVVDSEGAPVKVPNDEYIWAKIDAKVAELRDEKVLEQLRKEGQDYQVSKRLSEAEKLESMKVKEIHGREVDMTRVIAAHPLLGREIYPFEYHPLPDYGCTVCHGGNGRGLVTDKAHGPVRDGEYEAAAHGPKPDFIETDKENDPEFAYVFNDKPGHHLLFQTTPLMNGSLMQARCVQCHQSTSDQIKRAVDTVEIIRSRKSSQVEAIREGITADEEALLALLDLKEDVLQRGVTGTSSHLQEKLENFQLTTEELDQISGRLDYLKAVRLDCQCEDTAEDKALARAVADHLKRDLISILGSSERLSRVEALFKQGSLNSKDEILALLRKESEQEDTNGSFFDKLRSYEKYKASMQRVSHASQPIQRVAKDSELLNVIGGETDKLTHSFRRGRQLFMSNACYSCHRISGYSRGGVGPELTQAGLLYPWYIKESITWPQADLKSSTMPNFRLDHEEVEDLMTYLLAQRGESRVVSEVDEKVALQIWESGEKMPWEEPLPAGAIKDVYASQLTFATEGCASCHRLKGFEGRAGFTVEKSQPSFDVVWKERKWFRDLFPERSIGSQIVATIENHAAEIDQRIQGDVRANGILEDIDTQMDRGVESFFPPFKFALRAKNKHFNDLLAQASNEEQKQEVLKQKQEYIDRVRRVMTIFIHEYGFGREIGPRLHWSGIYRDQQWLVEHFRNPTSHAAKSLMPVFPYDDTKFYALTHMLQVLAKKNRDDTRQIWQTEGFSPELAYEMHCASCHGQFMNGDGPIATWIYPIPKNLRNGTILKNLTPARVANSLIHGVQGGPMPPWGESAKDPVTGEDMGIPVLTNSEIELLTNWLFVGLAGEGAFQEDEEIKKWRYEPEDFLEELQEEGGAEQLDLGCLDGPYSILPKAEGLWASLDTPRGWESEETQLDVSEIFEVRPVPRDVGQEFSYYIKEKYYTEANLSEGRRLFIANCAHCHGKEGGGNGDRAATMDDAKPRMLSNLKWIDSRDDLRLLRSIKYGVPGTSMTTWGDKTSALQRMQMVMFIRHLTADKKKRELVSSILFEAFEAPVILVEGKRYEQGVSVLQVEEAYEKAKKKREALFVQVEQGLAQPEEATKSYQEELELMTLLSAKEKSQEYFLKLVQEINAEKKLWTDLGNALINNRVEEALMKSYRQLVALNQERYRLSDERLVMKVSDEKKAQVQSTGKELEKLLMERENTLRSQLAVAEGQLPSAERTERIQDLGTEITAFEALRRKLASTLALVMRSVEKQQELYEVAMEKALQGDSSRLWKSQFLPSAA